MVVALIRRTTIRLMVPLLKNRASALTVTRPFFMRENLSQTVNLCLVRLIPVDVIGKSLQAFFMLARLPSDHPLERVSDSCGKGGGSCGQH